MEKFELTNHPTKKSFINDGENIKGYWIDSTQMGKFLGKNKSVLIQNILNGTIANDLLFTKEVKALNFFISLEDDAFDYRDARLLAGLNNLLEEDLIIDDKPIYEIKGNRTKVRGVWVNTEILMKLTGKSHGFINNAVKEDSLPLGVISKVDGRNFRYFLPTSKPSYTKEEALNFFQTRQILSIESKFNFLNSNSAKLKDFDKLVTNLLDKPEIINTLLKLSNIKVEDLEKMYEFNKKLMKLFPDG